MKVLWLCNVVLPDFCKEFNIKRTVVGGWMSGMLACMEQQSEIEIGLCFPIRDISRLKKGMLGRHSYYSFHCHMDSCEDITQIEMMVNRFIEILKEYQPDVIHIWGTEYIHSMAMAKACEKEGLEKQIIIHIQGLVSIYAKHFSAQIPEKYMKMQGSGYTLEEKRQDFIKRGVLEQQLLKKAYRVMGRTEWDKACTYLYNKNAKYHFCNEILRGEFYSHIGEWKKGNIEKHIIFISQGNYPIKGLHFIIKALPAILDEFPDTIVQIAGEDIFIPDKKGSISPYARYLDELMSIRNIRNRFVFLGCLDEIDMCRYYLKCSIFVSASTVENSSNSVCEAKLLGVPVVASYVGGMGSLITHMFDGVLYQYDACYMLSYYICKLFREPDIAERISINAAKAAVDMYDKLRNMETTLEIYREITEHKV